MPVIGPVQPLTPTGTIATLKPLVLDALQNRTDISDSMIARYVARQLEETTESMPFEELRQFGPIVALTAGVTDYPIEYFMNSGDDYTSPESFVIYIDYPSNTVLGDLKYKTPKAIETMTAPVTMGVPAWWSRFGGAIRIGPTPLNPYSVQMKYQGKHPFSDPPSIDDPIYITRSWFDIIAYGAAMRIAIAKRWTDQRKELHDLLYGDPEFMASEGKRGRPGLISARVMQVERDQKFDTRQISVVTPRYGPR